jgi:hypothetical protein
MSITEEEARLAQVSGSDLVIKLNPKFFGSLVL